MTFNEFKFCCIIFTKTFEGLKYGDVVKNCYREDCTIIISIKDVVFTPLNSFGYTVANMLFGLSNRVGLIIYIYGEQSVTLNTIKEFLEYFNITLEDTV